MNHLYFLYFTYNELLQSTKKHKQSKSTQDIVRVTHVIKHVLPPGCLSVVSYVIKVDQCEYKSAAKGNKHVSSLLSQDLKSSSVVMIHDSLIHTF